MPELYTDVLSFAEIGGVGKMIYRTVRFSKYALELKDGVQLLRPKCSAGCETITKTDYTLTGQKLLASLCNLYKKINDPSSEEPFVELIMRWCAENAHPYAIDELYDMLSDNDFDIASDGFLVERGGIFADNDFVRDLSNIYIVFTFFFALNELKRGSEEFAYNLYGEGKFYDGLPFFEKYKGKPAERMDEKGIQKFFSRNPLDDSEYLQNTLLSMFPEFHMKLKINPQTKRIVYAADVKSIFDICWYTLSRMVADDTPPMDYDDDRSFGEGSILSCLCCGEFYIRRSSTQKYCGNPNCKAERNRRKSRAYYKRKSSET